MRTGTTAAENKARALLARMDLERLIEQFELTESINDPNIPTVRGWIMDELENRNHEAFEAWTDSDDVFLNDPIESGPRKWFIPSILIERRGDGRGWLATWETGGNVYTDRFQTLKESKSYFDNWPAKTIRVIR